MHKMKAPSQLSEYWCWVPEWPPNSGVATSTSQPRTMNTGPKQILGTLIQNLIAKQVSQGILTLRQVAFSKSDIRIHEVDSQAATSLGDVYNSLLQERRPCAAQRAASTGTMDMSRHQIICGAQRPITTPTCCMFGFIRAWHGYVLTVCDPRTQILAADMWFSMFRPDPMSREAGERYP